MQIFENFMVIESVINLYLQYYEKNNQGAVGYLG